MFHDCVKACPAHHWDGLIAKYPFWMVAYHTLCFVDLYLSPGEKVWQPRTETHHPKGWAELDEEYPSRAFTQEELLAYTRLCRGLVTEVLGEGPNSETPESLDGPSGFSRQAFSRAELHVYNIRHIKHHTGQLSAFLRRVGVDTSWAKSGWDR